MNEPLSPAHTTKFFLTSSLVALLARVYNEQVSPQVFLDKTNIVVKENLSSRAHEQIKLVKGKLVKENLVVCTGLYTSECFHS